MIEKLKNTLKNAKYMTMTFTDLGEQVQISVTVRPKDGKDSAAPLQVKTDYLIADAVLMNALTDPPKPGKEKIAAAETNEKSDDLF